MKTVLLDSASPNQIDPILSAEAIRRNDHELNGTVNRAASEGAKFGLILAMLDLDCTHRPQVESSQQAKSTNGVLDDLHYYRTCPLSANEGYWQNSRQTSQLIHQGQMQSAHLWLAMHPEPLSQHNNVDEINAEVTANCGFVAQSRLQPANSNVIKVDETELYDILQELAPAS